MLKDRMNWDKTTQDRFEQMIARMPVFLREVGRRAVLEKAELRAGEAGRPLVTEKDMVDAFFDVTPFGFQGLMKNDLTGLGIDYTKYGYPK